jgi:hypothetical protein
MSGVRAAARVVLAAVWLYEGLWCKILRRRPDQRAIVAATPYPPIVLRSIHDRSPLPGRPLPDRSLLWGAVTLVETGG